MREEAAGVLSSRRFPPSFYASRVGPLALGVSALAMVCVKGEQAVELRLVS